MSWNEPFPPKEQPPSLRSSIVILVVIFCLALADWIRAYPDSNAQVCGSDEDCVRICLHKGYPMGYCNDVLAPADEPQRSVSM